MPIGINTPTFLADHSQLAQCLSAIRTAEKSGSFAAHPEILKQLRLLEGDALKKLFNVTLRILRKIDGSIQAVGGDFAEQDFSAKDFYTGLLNGGNTGSVNGTDDDFADEDFAEEDFYMDFPDNGNNDYSSVFEVIISVFNIFSTRLADLADADKASLDAALISFIEIFEALQEMLLELGLSPCTTILQQLNFNNSPGIYIQAAGSTGSDGTVAGIHLRWSLRGDIAEKHLPKGINSSSSGNYNKANDFFSVYRTPYTGALRITLDFETDKPSVNFLTKQWVYNLNTELNGQIYSSRIKLNFKDKARYTQVARSIDAMSTPLDFLKQYDGLLEIDLSQKSAYVVNLDYRRTGSSGSTKLRLDAFNASPDLTEEGLQVPLFRRTVTVNSNNPVSEDLFGEDIKRIKLKSSAGGYLKSFSFETYDDLLKLKQPTDWEFIGNTFALSLDDTEVYERLETAGKLIDNLWPQYNGGTTVRKANYVDKWSVSRTDDPSIKSTVNTYLQLSETDPRATGVIKADGVIDAPEMSVSYLDVLNMMAMDFHIARMLGLGFIDVPANASDADRFIYRISYSNRKDLLSSEVINYQYISIPTSKNDSRLPAKPTIKPIEYGLVVQNTLSETAFDSNGYCRFDKVRAVNVRRELYNYENATEGFFSNPSIVENFTLTGATRPILFGVEYKAAGQSNYAKPEITTAAFLNDPSVHIYLAHDSSNPGGFAETAPVPDNLTSLYLHFERNPGVHHYAIYGINWFSRASAISDEAVTDATAFPVKNTLKPPGDVSVQYIQEEEPLLFTTQLEQNWLEGRSLAFPGADVNFTRLTFNWLDIVDISDISDLQTFALSDISRATKVKATFKSALPLELRGEITNTALVSGEDKEILVFTGPYTLLDGTIVSPAVQPSDFDSFINSILDTVEGKFKILELTAGSAGPVFRVEKIAITETLEDPLLPGSFSSVNRYVLPEPGSKFTTVENLSNANNWSVVQEDVDLIDFVNPSSLKIETEIDSEGKEFNYLIGGLHGTADIEVLTDLVTDLPISGHYVVSFNPAIALPAHPQVNIPFNPASPGANSPTGRRSPHVEWYKGLLRTKGQNGEMKLLEVFRILQLDPLVVYITDPNYQQNEIVLAEPTLVNFHPGYKAYLFTEPDGEFKGSNILPADDSNDRKTLIGVQSVNVGGAGFVSEVSLPAILFARKTIKLLQPELPVALNYKIRPDATGKAAFTFDTKISPESPGQLRKPFGFAFYRTNQAELLSALYEPATVAAIHAQLAELTSDSNYIQRFLDVANSVFDPANAGNFKIYDAEPANYGLPVPDKAGLVDSGDSATIKEQKYIDAIRATFLPLTEQAPVLNFIKTGTQTENSLPKIRDVDGNLLDMNSPEFDPFPMIRQYQKTGEPDVNYIRFTDYSLNDSSRNLYFYAGAEVNNQLIPGPLSSFAGPVEILHTLPATAPAVRSVSIDISANGNGGPLSVKFLISPFSNADNISKIRVYRSFSQAGALMLELMDSYFDVDFDNTELSITDSFDDLTTTPLGETVYYRLVGVREIINELGEPEEVLSQASDVLDVKLVDIVNPEAPELAYVPAGNKLTWLPTTNKGTYYIYRQNSRGNWEKLSSIQPAPGNVSLMEYALPTLVQTDEDGDPVYNRFKVKVENSAGLFNITDKELTI